MNHQAWLYVLIVSHYLLDKSIWMSQRCFVVKTEFTFSTNSGSLLQLVALVSHPATHTWSWEQLASISTFCPSPSELFQHFFST
jgi:hypothetical protein